jgi:DNA repair exonuclease SbcCD ATPase subunit
MTNPIANWWRSRQFYAALKSNETKLAIQLLEEIQQSGASLSVLEKTFRDQLYSNQRLDNAEREILALRQQVSQLPQTSEDHRQEIEDLGRQLAAASEQRQELERLLEQRQQEVKRSSRDQQQAEQTVAELIERLKQKQQEAALIQQQLEADGQTIKSLHEQLRQQQEVASAQQQLEANGQAIKALHEHLRQQRQEVASVRQQLEVNGQEIKALNEQLRQKSQEFILAQQQLEVNEQEITNLNEQLRQKSQELISSQQQVAAHEQHIQELRQQRDRVLEQNQKLERLLGQKRQTVDALSRNSQKAKQFLESLRRDLQRQLEVHGQEAASQQKFSSDSHLLTPDINFIRSVANKFRLVERDRDVIECTGIDNYIFDELEANLVEYLQAEFSKYNLERPSLVLRNAMGEVNGLRANQESQYGYDLTPYAYFMRYFLENVYSSYLAWLLIYRHGLLQTKANILDIAAGAGTVACGLALFLQSNPVTSTLQNQFSYYSLEKQDLFQYHGFQFWRQYIDTQERSTNAYFRYDTTDIFANSSLEKIPEGAFDFIVVFHRLFSDRGEAKSYETYREIFTNSLTDKGYVLLTIQSGKLLKTYNLRKFENHDQEQDLIEKLVRNLGLNLEWYKYITSTGKRVFTGDFREYARRTLPPQPAMSVLMRQYLGTGYMRQKLRLGDKAYYTLDDYVILARK